MLFNFFRLRFLSNITSLDTEIGKQGRTASSDSLAVCQVQSLSPQPQVPLDAHVRIPTHAYTSGGIVSTCEGKGAPRLARGSSLQGPTRTTRCRSLPGGGTGGGVLHSEVVTSENGHLSFDTTGLQHVQMRMCIYEHTLYPDRLIQ